MKIQGRRQSKNIENITARPIMANTGKGSRPKTPNYSLAGSIKALGKASISGMQNRAYEGWAKRLKGR